MRPSRVPVSSLDRRDLVDDPGGLRCGSPRRRTDTAFQHVETVRVRVGKEQAPSPLLILSDHDFKQLSRLYTDPADLLPPALDLHLLRPTGSATGLVANLYPREDFHLLDDID
jgi:hypothetical protein